MTNDDGDGSDIHDGTFVCSLHVIIISIVSKLAWQFSMLPASKFSLNFASDTIRAHDQVSTMRSDEQNKTKKNDVIGAMRRDVLQKRKSYTTREKSQTNEITHFTFIRTCVPIDRNLSVHSVYLYTF